MIAKIEQYIADNFTAAKLTFDGVEPREYGAPEAPLLIVGNSNYVVVDVSEDIVRTATVGNSLQKVMGSISLEVHTVNGSGKGPQHTIVNALRVLIKGKSFSNGVGRILVRDGTKLAEYVKGKWRVRVDQFSFEYTTSDFS